MTNYRFEPLTDEQVAVIDSIAPNLLFCGQGGCGKSHTGAAKAFIIGAKYKKGCVALVRKKRTDLKATLWKFFIDKVLQDKYVVKKNDTELYRKLVNGTEFYGIGLDSTGDVNKLASREYNFVVIEEATELTEEDYDEKIIRTTRLPSSPWHQILSLCNPKSKNHWLYKRFFTSGNPNYVEFAGKTLPPPYLPKVYYTFLSELSGIFAERYVKGRWVGAEGIVYPFDPTRHVIDPFVIPEDWQRVVSLDFGFSLLHAFCVQWWAISQQGKWYCYRQIYMTGKTVEELAPIIRSYMIQDGIEKQEIICDHSADGRATLNRHGVKTRPAIKKRLEGQQICYNLIAKDKVFFFNNSLVETDIDLKMNKLPYQTEQEFEYYTWATKEKEDMIRKLDHGMDTMRYGMRTMIRSIGESINTLQYMPRVLTR
jgi:PBSX family phage terminase large subunit